MLKILRILLFPFSLIYGLIILFRNVFYDLKVLKSTKFNIHIISIGNLVAGGTGKTPMTEYLLKVLKNEYKIATLSRGYGRKTKGFIVAASNAKSILVGDEPKQYKSKFPDVIVAVGENRVEAINALQRNYQPEIILLDDAYQHRAVSPGLSILLFDYSNIFKPDFMLPTGNLRELKVGKSRADIFVVTKCPTNLSLEERQRITLKLIPSSNQKLYFSYVFYNDLLNYSNDESSRKTISVNDLKDFSILLLTGIANPKPMNDYLSKFSKEVVNLSFKDHHVFTEEDILKVKNRYLSINNSNKIMLTTEKDLMRLTDFSNDILGDITPIYYVPISSKFFDEDENAFNQQILNYVRSSK